MYEADAARSLRPALFCQGLAILAFAIGFLAALTQCLLERGARRGFPGRPNVYKTNLMIMQDMKKEIH
jgi:hypothetical protein